mgnify:CR=1 FL=1
MSLRIAASLASAPMARLGQVIGELETAQVDIIHFDYPAWHTHRDLPDQTSAASLAEVARVGGDFVDDQRAVVTVDRAGDRAFQRHRDLAQLGRIDCRRSDLSHACFGKIDDRAERLIQFVGQGRRHLAHRPCGKRQHGNRFPRIAV